MICMSPSSTVDIVTKISKQYDSRVLLWASELKKVCECIIIFDAIILYVIQKLLPTQPTQPSQSTVATLKHTSRSIDR